MQKTGVRVFKLFCVDCESAVILLLCLTLMQIHNYILLKLQILFVELVDFLLRLNGQLTKGRLNQFSLLTVLYYFPPFTTRPCAYPEGGRGVRTPLKNHKSIGFLSNSGPDPLENHKITMPAFNVGPSSIRQQNAT